MAFLAEIWTMLEGSFTSGFTKAKEEVRDVVDEVRSAMVLIQSADETQQKQGLDRLNVVLTNFVGSKSWKYVSSLRNKTISGAVALIAEVHSITSAALAQFDDEEKRKEFIEELKEKAHKLVEDVVDYLAPGFTSTLTFKVLILVLPASLTYFTGKFLESQNRLKLESHQVTHPLNAFTLKGDVYEPTEAFQDTFWHVFPTYYFNHINLKPNVDWMLAPYDSITVKLVLNNPSESFPIMVSTINTTITKDRDKPFEWEKTVTDPTFEVEPDYDKLSLRITNPSAAIAVVVDVKSPDGNLLFTDSVEAISDRWSFDPFEDFETWQLTDADGFVDVDTLVFDFDDALPSDSTETVMHTQPTEYVTSPQRLIELTNGEVIDFITIALSYETLKGARKQVTLNYTLPKKLLIHDKDAPVLVLKKWTRNYELDSSIRASIIAPLAEQLYKGLGGEAQPHPEGYNMIKTWANVDLSNVISKGNKQSVMTHIDKVLNPKGFVVMFLKIEPPSNGKFKVAISLNGERPSYFYIDALVPEETHFSYPESLKHFRKKNTH